MPDPYRFTARCACNCLGHRRRGDLASAIPQCATRIPASAVGGLCHACAVEHVNCAIACAHRPIWRP
jgi:hypothetical protein